MRKRKKYTPTKFKADTSYYNKDAADFAVAFIESLCHTKGTWAGKPFELIDWQEQTKACFRTVNHHERTGFEGGKDYGKEYVRPL